MANQRASNFLKKPTFQFHRFLFIFSIIFCVVSAILAYIMAQVQENMVSLLEMTNMAAEMQDQFKGSFTQLALVGFVCYQVTGFFIFIYSLYLSHKFSGPVKVIVALLRQLREGNYKITRQLRENDELKEIILEVHELAKTLEGKYGPSAEGGASNN